MYILMIRSISQQTIPTKTESDIAFLIGYGSQRPLVRCPSMSKNKTAALVALHGTDVDVNIILQRDRILYGEFHPMNESVAPLQNLETPIERHQISLPARKSSKYIHLYI